MVVLKKGSRGGDVERVQLLLNSALHPSPRLGVDGDFGQLTEDAVILFQKRHGLKQDGVVGHDTWTALGQRLSVAPRSQTAAAAAPALAPVAPESKTDWMTIARAEFGVQENSLPGQDNQRIVEYHKTTTLDAASASSDETAWCSSFVNWVMTQAGYRGTRSAAARSWLKWGIALETPRVGAITVIYSEKAKKAADAQGITASGFHVGFWLSATETSVRLLGGNQGGKGIGKVKESNFSLSDWEVKGYRWPG